MESRPETLRGELEAAGRNVTLVGIDEIQKAPALLEEIQFLYDREPERWQFFLTGSSARRLRGSSSNLLPGRCHVYHLLPLIRMEESGSRGAPGKTPPAVPAERKPSRNGDRRGTRAVRGEETFPDRDLSSRLLFGNLPGVVCETTHTAAATLDAYVENYLEEEIRREGLVRNLGAFHVFLRLAACESGQMVNLARLSQESGVPASTLKLYYQVLVDTFVGYWLNSYGGSGRKRLLATPRFYFFDLGVRNAAARFAIGGDLPPDIGGRLLEHWAGLELLHRAAYAGRGHEVTFWRTVSGAEVDFIWTTPTEDVPIEVKWTENPGVGDARHMEIFLDLHTRRARRAFLVCRVERPRRISERVTAIPWQAL